MKNFLLAIAFTFLFSTTTFAVVANPPTRPINLDPGTVDDGNGSSSSPGNPTTPTPVAPPVNVTEPSKPGAPTSIEPAEPIRTPPDRIIEENPGGDELPVPTKNLNNYDIFGTRKPDYRPLMIVCLCLLLIAFIAVSSIIYFFYVKSRKLEPSPLLDKEKKTKK